MSLIVPCRNEAGFIAACIDSVLANDFPTSQLEILVVDGMSEDGTREIVRGYSRRYPFIHLLDNPKKTTPFAMNVGIVIVQWRKPYYKHEALNLEDRGFPETEALSREVCSLPMNVELDDEEVEYVIRTVRSFHGVD